MNNFQDKKYWRRWGAVVRANDWRWLGGHLVASAQRDTSEHHLAVWSHAEALAETEARAVVANDLRKACHVHALGSALSHLKLTDQQFDRLLLLWGNERKIAGLLIDPLQLKAVMVWEDPAEHQRQNTVEYISRLAPERVLISIAEGHFNTKFWNDLPRPDLLELGRIVRNRNDRHHTPVAAEPLPF